LPGSPETRCRTVRRGHHIARAIVGDRDHTVMNGMLRSQTLPGIAGCPCDADGQREGSMTPDGVAPDLHHERTPAPRPSSEWHGLADLDCHAGGAPDLSDERVRLVRVALIRARDELLRAHASTVLDIRRLSRDRAPISSALVEARSCLEAMFLVRRAVDALTTPARRVSN